jgi:hypothetical protein
MVSLPDSCFVVSIVIACKPYLTFQVMLSLIAFVYFKEYGGTEQSHTYPEKLVQTVGTLVTLLQTIMAEVAHLSSVKQHISCHHEWC